MTMRRVLLATLIGAFALCATAALAGTGAEKAPAEKATAEKETVEKETVEKETIEKETAEKETAENETAENETAEKRPAIKGSIKVTGDHSDAELTKMAKVTEAEAEKNALKEIKGAPADKKVSDTTLEVEDGFLIYWVEIKIKGQDGIEAVLIDAGNGKVLARSHESEKDEEGEDEEEAGD